LSSAADVRIASAPAPRPHRGARRGGLRRVWVEVDRRRVDPEQELAEAQMGNQDDGAYLVFRRAGSGARRRPGPRAAHGLSRRCRPSRPRPDDRGRARALLESELVRAGFGRWAAL